MLKLSTSYKHHFLVAIIIGVWLVLFLVLIAPFDTADLPMPIRVQILPPYGLISIVGYCILVPAQNWLFKKAGKWNTLFESIFLLAFNVIVWIGSYLYYKTDIINGVYSFSKFTLEVYYPIFFIILPILIFVRWYLNKRAPDTESDKIILSGENKLDVLQIKQSDLICISSADNYVEVTYLTKEGVNRKLLRTTLKNVHAQKPELVKVHRSHVINPQHFKEWKDSNTILLTEMELPVSKSYKQNLISLDHSPLKADSLSQT
ncbi:hypothetical protein BFP97_07075 [Roseivirga sp. 4D4]|uniref:LytTR family DNA-binding domain-containing protein n=1 Tax=Roseivirga sp. 4D4 TaxID=1889784 RepID=UPI000853A905|nr:LytTR family DNA-binding domain-containing protein [Roseivirga sp. 4D4]OEK01289.1 hypothetical protein BFP97_07075 [Roseivirga sp. 4D4]